MDETVWFPEEFVDFPGVIEGLGGLRYEYQPSRREGTRHLRNVRDAQNVQERRTLPVGWRRIVENHLLHMFVEKSGVKAQNAHYVFSVDSDGGRRGFFFGDDPLNGAQDVPDLHACHCSARPRSGPLDLRVVGSTYGLLG